MPTTRREMVFFILGGFFLTNAILAEMTGGKLFQVETLGFTFTLSIGVLLWPVVFVTTDLINEYYGKPGVRRLTFLAVGMISFAFLVLYCAVQVPTFTPPNSKVTHEAFAAVFGQSQWIIVGSLVAFLVSQLVDVFVFSVLRKLTEGRLLWLRATGSTAISQLIDSYIVAYIGFVVPGFIAFDDCMKMATNNYLFKLSVAIAITPLIYFGHHLIERYFAKGQDEIPDAR